MSSYPARLLLVRHGETDWNQAKIPQGHADISLNSKGREQARALALRLRGWDIDCIYSSDLARASETAAILGNAVGLAPGWCQPGGRSTWEAGLDLPMPRLRTAIRTNWRLLPREGMSLAEAEKRWRLSRLARCRNSNPCACPTPRKPFSS